MLSAYFQHLADQGGPNVSIAYDAFDRDRFLLGLWTTVELSALCIVCSIVIGVLGAWVLAGQSRTGHALVRGYVQLFRNTPPLVQLSFFYFAVSGLLPANPTGPLVSGFGWAVIAFSLFAGAFNVEIFRSGIEAVPHTTVEAAQSLGYGTIGLYRWVLLPLGLRICLPGLTNNLVNLVKSTTLAYAIGVPDLLYAASQIWSEVLNVREMMNALLVTYLLLVALLVWMMERWERALAIPGAPCVMQVLLPVAPLLPSFQAKPILAGATLPIMAAVGLLLSVAYAQAASGAGQPGVVAALLRWAPVIVGGLLINIGISILAMALGTVLGLPLGLWLMARARVARAPAWAVTQFFRNVPWLVLLFYVMFLTPFQIQIGGVTVPLPAWAKAVVGLALPVAANVAEIVRGGVRSIPATQWSAAESLGFGRLATLRMVILPQALRRMLPPWVNLHAVLTMASSLISVVGIQDGLTLTKAALAAEGRPDLLIPMYLLLLLLFFAYCYPVSRLTLVLERRLHIGAA